MFILIHNEIINEYFVEIVWKGRCVRVVDGEQER